MNIFSIGRFLKVLLETLIISLLFICLLNVESYADIEEQGDCGETATYTLYRDGDNYRLEISGTGAISNGPNTFYENLITSITIGEGITEICPQTFNFYGSLSNISLPSTLKVIGAYAFEHDKNLESILIPESVERIDSCAFWGCESIKNIHIPKNVSSIGESAFNDCPDLETITVDRNNPVFDSRNNSNAIIETKTDALIIGCKNTTISKGITTIWHDAFECNIMDKTYISIPESVTSIGDEAFCQCEGLSGINIPKGVKNIGDRAFFYCGLVGEMSLPDSITSLGEQAFYGCNAVTEFIIPGSVKTIKDGAFSPIRSFSSFDSIEYTALKKVTIKEGVEEIGRGAFWCANSLECVYIPHSVSIIDSTAFEGCGSLSTVYYNGTKNEWNALDKGDQFSGATIHFTDGTSDDDVETFDKLLESSSYDYNNDLALIAAEMCLATYSGVSFYDSSAINNYLSSLGFDNIDSSCYSLFNLNHFTVATKEYTGKDSDGNTDVMVIVAQGTTNPYQQIKDVTSLPVKNIPGLLLYGGYDIVVDFYNKIDDMVSKLKEPGKKYKVLITGHSLGGAAANLTAAVYNNRADDRNDIFAYTFGAINVFIPNASITKGYENIHNVYNKLDTFSPEEYGGFLVTGMGGGYGKYGHMDFYINEHRNEHQQSLANPVDQIIESVNHGMAHYVEDVSNGVVQDSILRECSENYNPPLVPVIVNATASMDVVTVNWHALNQRIIQGSSVGYEVQCSSKQLFESDVKKETISGYDTNTKAISVSDLQTLDNQYYARIRSFIRFRGITFYSRWSDTVTVKQNAFVSKKTNPMTAKAKKITVKYSVVKKKKQTVTAKKIFTIKNAKGRITYANTAYDKKAKKKIKVSKSGALTVSKGLKKGSYKLKVKITAAGNAQYKAKSENVTVSVIVK